jgi:hypothetical protein
LGRYCYRQWYNIYDYSYFLGKYCHQQWYNIYDYSYFLGKYCPKHGAISTIIHIFFVNIAQNLGTISTFIKYRNKQYPLLIILQKTFFI